MTDHNENTTDVLDVVVIGGGAAGLSGALTLVRQRRSVVVVDAGAPRNAPAAGVHGLLALDGTPPAELVARGRAEVEGYGGRVVDDRVVSVTHVDAGFEVTLAEGAPLLARRLLVATGLVDELPDVPGVAERWGRDVIHCPFCHGWESRDRRIGVLAASPMSVHQALMLRQLSDDVRFFAHGVALSEDDRATLDALDVPVFDGAVERLEIDDDAIRGVRLAHGAVVEVDVVAVGTRLHARADFLAGIGLEPVEHMMGTMVPADEAGRTPVPGVWVAGNATDLMAQVSGAAADAARVAAQIHGDLMMTDLQATLAARGGKVSA
ncbi:NAD(P)/FAD-dependent oxidoreductase [Nocardioides sp. AX2bis]|uniref:NAD(P)/FAD-dependent oxidoreductase n=1 Tax=Nocardioides sp. AX2bis TaxID=2653157 RepID=UPI0012F06BA2|nr:NAD(P)/FAD-dependent oxidoreductase [Nocardioides sp. AX2bis]VXC29573.1 Thioredoxin reductase [Nocardioides sp. AX2bis]